MGEYFRRLKQHEGVPVGVMITSMIFICVAGNKSVKSLEDVIIMGSIISLIFPWSLILISNFKK
jgi:hypothetical protein